jgi:hypothetical protein
VRRLLCLVAIVAPAVLAPVADAAFPGANGRIAYDVDEDCFGENYHLDTVNPDGSSRSSVPTPGVYNQMPAWSPDGVRLAYSEDYSVTTIKPDGSDRQNFSAPSLDESPAWSPDGTRIVFASEGEITFINADGTGRSGTGRFGSEPSWSPDGSRIAFGAGGDIYLMDPDAGNLTNVTNSAAFEGSPEWSPNGARLALSSNRDGPGIFTMKRDGSDFVRVTSNAAGDHSPAWSPDGNRIAFERNFRIWSASSAGGGEVQVSSGFPQDCHRHPDWQPLPALGYPRPRGASPMYLSLVPAYQPCTAPNRTHGAPLSFGSCSPPAATSSELTLGPKSVSAIVINAKSGNRDTVPDEADVRFKVTVRDVRRSSDLSDYTGQLEARPVLRITDRDNTPHPGGPGPGTTVDIALTFAVPCTATPDTTVGATCEIATTADVVAPGSVKEERRSVWAFDAIEVREADGAPFLRQGLFVP